MAARMQYSTANRSIVALHHYVLSANRVKPEPAQDTGICEKCHDPIEVGAPISWDRTFGVFHVACYKSLTSKPALDEARVIEIVSEEIAKGNGSKASLDAIKDELDRIAQVAASQEVDAAVEKLTETIDAIKASIASVSPAIDEQAVANLVTELVAKAALPKTLVVKSPEKPKGMTVANPHRMLKELIKLVGRRKHTYLYGPAGTGKTTATMVVAEIFGLRWGYVSLNPQTPESRLLGYKDASTGTYVATLLYDFVLNGGLFCIDEMDNSSGALLACLNGLLANKKASFPCGVIEAHADFVVVSTGNTNGLGGNKQFPDRRPLDGATRDRFQFLHWGYDPEQERALALGINAAAGPWIDWVFAVRAWADIHDEKLIASPRVTYEIAEAILDPEFNVEVMLDGALFKGLPPSHSTRLLAAVPVPTTGAAVAA